MSNPYEPPKEDSRRHLKSSDRWGERHRPPTTDWYDVVFVMLLALLMLFSSTLVEWLVEILRGWIS